MKKLIAALLIFSLIPYLEWGNENHAFLLEIEIELWKKGLENPYEIFHPLILLPFAGQLILIFTLFKKEPKIRMIQFGAMLVALLVFFIFLSGVLSKNLKMIPFSLPYLVFCVLVFLRGRQNQKIDRN